MFVDSVLLAVFYRCHVSRTLAGTLCSGQVFIYGKTVFRSRSVFLNFTSSVFSPTHNAADHILFLPISRRCFSRHCSCNTKNQIWFTGVQEQSQTVSNNNSHLPDQTFILLLSSPFHRLFFCKSLIHFAAPPLTYCKFFRLSVIRLVVPSTRISSWIFGILHISCFSSTPQPLRESSVINLILKIVQPAMAATLSTGSPKLGKKASSNFVVLDQNEVEKTAASTPSVSPSRR